jgi:glycosyltransferase involved in cell wall biosynthesis
MPRVSVVINAHNGEGTLAEAIESVFQQTWRDWELVIWDDGSTDGTARVLERYSGPHVRFFRAPAAAGLGRSRQQALARTEGEWVAFLDQDDLWLPDKLESQIARVDGQTGSRVGLVYGRAVAFDAAGHQREYDHRHEYIPLPEGDIFEELFRNGCFIAMSTAMFSRAAVEAIGPIPAEIYVSPDYYMYAAAARHFEARAVQRVVCRYRLHPGSMSRSNGLRIQQEGLWILDRWASCLDPKLVEERRAKHHSVAAYYDMLAWRTAARGALRLVRNGSPAFLLSRAPARLFRGARRTWATPLWRTGELR